MGTPIPSIYDYRVISRIGSAPVTAAEVVAQVKGDPDWLNDPEIAAFFDVLIKAAIDVGERLCKRVLWQANFKAYLDFFINRVGIPINFYRGFRINTQAPYEVRRAPLVSISSITRTVNGVPVVIDPADYYFTPSETDFSFVVPASGKDWPTDGDEILHSIEFDFVAGYTAANIPSDLKHALLLHLAAMWANRGDCSGAWSGVNAAGCAGCPLPPGAQAIYSQHRIYDLRQGL